jgi:S-adenosyl-L-methionine hydrolase (adenosine-forming)
LDNQGKSFYTVRVGAFITLTTDFGLKDGYVAALKGVILSLNPEAVLVDLCHAIQPQNIRQAAFVLNTAYRYFPLYTVHLVVIDPEVGTNRRPVILKTPRAYFVAPDNGVLSYITSAYKSQPIPDSGRVKLGPELKAYTITRSEYWRKPLSRTFHGRDIFAPVAARLSLGMAASGLGDEIDSLTVFPLPRPFQQEGALIGHILHIDRFGNLITDIEEATLPAGGESFTIEIRGAMIRGIAQTYAGGEGPIALFGSSGYLEIAIPNGNAAAFFRAQAGDQVKVQFGPINAVKSTLED